MRELLLLLLHFPIAVARLLGSGGARALVAENLLIKRKLLVLARSRRRSPNLRPRDRVLLGFWSLFLRRARIEKVAVALRSATLLAFHQSSDNDPLFDYHRGRANLRILDVEEIKAVPYTPTSNSFLERLIGTIRREFLDQTLFWNPVDLETKLLAFQDYFNLERVHGALAGATPDEIGGRQPEPLANLNGYRWRSHCRDLYRLPAAA